MRDLYKEVRTSCRERALGFQWPTVEQPQPRWGRSAAMVEGRTWVNIAIRLCLHSFLAQNKHHLFENKVWEIYIKQCIRSFVEVVIISWLCSRVYLYTPSILYNIYLYIHLFIKNYTCIKPLLISIYVDGNNLLLEMSISTEITPRDSSNNLRFLFTQPLCCDKEMTQCHCLCRVNLVWFRFFLLLDWLPN